MSINLACSAIVIFINAILLYLLHFKMMAVSAIDDSSARFQEAMKASEFARVSFNLYDYSKNLIYILSLDANCWSGFVGRDCGHFIRRSCERVSFFDCSNLVFVYQIEFYFIHMCFRYEKDSMERRAIVYDIFGKNTTTTKFVDQHPSIFLRNGYDGENLLLA